MKVCPKCRKVLAYNSYFGAYICTDCGWEDARVGTNRNKGGNYGQRLSIKAPKGVSTQKVLASK